jgi:predicted esterase
MQHITFEPIHARWAVVWLHGFGDAPEDWANEFRTCREALAHVRWTHVRAPQVSQTCYNGLRMASWGNYRDQGCTHVGSLDYESRDLSLMKQ